MKKIFTSLSAVLLTVGAAYSQQEQPAFSVAASALNPTNAKVESVVNFTNSAVSSAAKLPEISDIISVAGRRGEDILSSGILYGWPEAGIPENRWRAAALDLCA